MAEKIQAKNLSEGMKIINIHPNPAQDDVIKIKDTKFISGKTAETDQVAFECQYGWSYLYANEMVEKVN